MAFPLSVYLEGLVLFLPNCVGEEHDVGCIRYHFAESLHIWVLPQRDFDKISFLLQEAFLDEVEITVFTVFFSAVINNEDNVSAVYFLDDFFSALRI